MPDVEGDKPAKKTFKTYPIGFFHIDIAEVQTEEGKLYLYVGIDRTSKFAFADLPKNRSGPTAMWRGHPFDRACQVHDIEHRLTKPKHPWTNVQVERMNRAIKDATVKRFHYDNHEQLRTHLQSFIAAYNFGRRLKTLKGLTPYECICKRWTIELQRFIIGSDPSNAGTKQLASQPSRARAASVPSVG